MNELITVSDKDGIQSVSARELHEKLEIGTSFKDWFPRMCEYGFKENEDFNSLKNEQVRMEGNREVKRDIQDYAISIEMAKQICMIQRSEKGREYREYFLKLEQAWNSPEAVIARGLQLANKKLEECKNIISIMSPKADVYDAISDSSTIQDLQTVSQTVGITNIFKVLVADGIIEQKYTADGTKYYKPFAQYSDYLVIKDGKPYETPDGIKHVRPRIFVTGKGINWLTKKYNTEKGETA